MKLISIILIAVFLLSCEKTEGPTTVSGYAKDPNGTILKNFSFELLSSCGSFCPPDKELDGTVITTDENGYYNFNFNAKKKYYYQFGFRSTRGYCSQNQIKNGKTQEINLIFSNVESYIEFKMLAKKGINTQLVYRLLQDETEKYCDTLYYKDFQNYLDTTDAYTNVPYLPSVNKINIRLIDNSFVLKDTTYDYILKSLNKSAKIVIQ
jgi:hypothetical protein